MLTLARFRMLAVMTLALPLLAACSSAGGPAATGGAPSGAAASSAPTDATATQAPTGAPATKAGGTGPVVDLTLSGWKSITMHGSAGTCIGSAAGFGFQAVEADYAGLGDGFYITEGGDGYTTIKWLAPGNYGFINIADIKDAVSADHKTITLDHDIKGGPGTEHIKGTVTCP
jgi:hypothetical protein